MLSSDDDISNLITEVEEMLLLVIKVMSNKGKAGYTRVSSLL